MFAWLVVVAIGACGFGLIGWSAWDMMTARRSAPIASNEPTGVAAGPGLSPQTITQPYD